MRVASSSDASCSRVCQRVPSKRARQSSTATSREPGLLTTVYLDEAEYDRFAALPALVMEKVRHSIGPFGIDEFAPPRERLCIAEAEFESEAEMNAFVVPSWLDLVAEVTNDIRFTGGRYVTMGAAGVEALLKDFAVLD